VVPVGFLVFMLGMGVALLRRRWRVKGGIEVSAQGRGVLGLRPLLGRAANAKPPHSEAWAETDAVVECTAVVSSWLRRPSPRSSGGQWSDAVPPASGSSALSTSWLPSMCRVACTRGGACQLRYGDTRLRVGGSSEDAYAGIVSFDPLR
jgi:hypothetical protein